MLAVAAGLFASCSQDIDLPATSEDVYQNPDKALAFLTDKYGAQNADSLIFNAQQVTDFYVNVNTAATAATEFTVDYDASVLAAYNEAHGTNYQALPQSLVTISGKAALAAGDIKSAPVSVSYTSADQLEENGTYAIPLSVKASGNYQVSEEKGGFVLFVRDITKMPNCNKGEGKPINIAMPEVNDSNPLDALCFTLKDSKKYFFDQVCMFSGNINYSEQTGEVYNYNNENVQHLLDYKEKYLEPLQQKGIKVIMGILGNHDRSALTNLTEEGAKAFAANVKAVCDAYGLDGVFLDDEYSSPGDYPGFETSGNHVSRLCYYLKEALGKDRLVEVYVYGGTSSLSEYNGKQPGEFIDYAIQDYGQYYDLSENYPGLAKSGMIQASSECAQGRYISEQRANTIVKDGYGGTMWFALDAARGRYSLDRMSAVARAFYGEDVVYDGKPYGKDW